MRSSWLVAIACCALPSVLSAQKGVIESCTPANPIVVDTNFDDWQTEWSIDPKGHFAYNVCNDDNNLYVRLKVTDEFTQRKIGLFGMTIFLNPSGKKVGKIGVKYPVPKDMEEVKKKTPTDNPTPADIERLKMDLVRNEDVLELVGLAKENIVSSRLGLMNGIEILIQPGDLNTFVYEAKIPFKAFQIDKAKVKTLGVAFVTGKLPVKVNNNTSAPVGGGPGNLGYANRYGMGYGGYGGYGYGSYSRGSGTQWTEWNQSTSLVLAVKLH